MYNFFFTEYVSRAELVKFKKQVVAHVTKQKYQNNCLGLDDDADIFKKLPLNTEAELDKYDDDLKNDIQKQIDFVSL